MQLQEKSQYYANSLFRYKIGEAFIYLKAPEALERLQNDTELIETAISESETQIDDTSRQMTALKGLLYAKFGDSINLE